ncbi:hypothetical protein ACWNYO_00630 [Candidatus Vidania fulgoroideorum]
MRILISTSGGIDSTFCLMRNCKIGYKNIYCLYIKISKENTCKYKQDISCLLNLKKYIRFKLLILNLEKEYNNCVFKPFILKYKKGLTPNCDILCNKNIKFRFLKLIGKRKRIKKIFTGHYIKKHKKKIFIPLDIKKDQSFFLCNTNIKTISFPNGFFFKSEIIFLVNFFNLQYSVSSRGICFIETDFKKILNQKIKAKIIYKNKNIGTSSFFKVIGQKVNIRNIKYYVYNKIRKNKTLKVCKNSNSLFLFSKLVEIKIKVKKYITKIKKVFIKIRNTSTLCKAHLLLKKKIGLINFIYLQKNLSVGQIISIYNKKKMLIASGEILRVFCKGFLNF